MFFAKRLILFATTFAVTLPSPAMALPSLGEIEDLAKIGKTAGSFETGVTKSGDVLIKVLNSEGNAEETIQMAVPTMAQLRAEAPSSWQRLTQGTGVKGVMVSTAVRFLPESFTFMVALGALAKQDLFFHYNENPAAFDQMIENQTSVVGAMGFGAFMLANGLTTNALRSVSFGSTKLRSIMVPLLGMSAGMTANKIVSELAQMDYPGLYQTMRACALQNDMGACDKAHIMFADAMHSHFVLNQVPSLVGMIGAMATVAASKWAITEGGLVVARSAGTQMAKIATLRLVGFEIISTYNEAGLIAKGMQLAVNVVFWGAQVAEIAGFMDVSNWIEGHVGHFWRNYETAGPDMISERSNLQRDLQLWPSNQSSTNLMKQLTTDLRRYGTAMDAFQENNSLDSVMAYNNWMSYANKLAGGYNYTHEFYQNFLTSIWNNQFGPAGMKQDFGRLYPLFGVQGPHGPYDSANYLNFADETEAGQMKTIQAVVTQMTADLRNLNNEAIKHIRDLLASNDKMKIADALDQINEISSTNGVLAWFSGSKSERDYILAVRQALGDPHPCRSPGQGYLRALWIDMQAKQYVDPFNYKADNPLEFLLYQMVAGPDAEHGESVIGETKTFMAKFRPPMVRQLGGIEQQWLHPAVPKQSQTLFDFGVRMQSDRHPLKSVFDFLILGGVRPTVLNTSNKTESSVPAWWKKNVESQYIGAWQDFDKKYQPIAVRFVGELHNPETALGNPEGLMASQREEFEIYMNAINRLTKLHADHPWSKYLRAQYDILENEIKKISVANVTAKDGTNQEVLVGEISAKTLYAARDASTDLIQQLAAMADESVKEGLHPREFADMVKTIATNLGKSLNSVVTNAELLNAVSYKWQYEDGIYRGGHCLESKLVTPGSNFREAPTCGHGS